ncbi:mRNA triphosphatase CET1 [Dothidotthia symphoricarpi CBS 119687]|uniref:mRNA-capping enzyme subunit beta n=1 Tax=Dothidotthia symphoricarpi CBS 119687 TaxID=1392245 RepID=A0A6A6AJ13_9PLEO|nr:mRNA triphosphatase CET1 [Dothidotthia symphoricarpi CBS 119687]KAF2131929.1 mRNA triphosphatase CET1 [Dothidotthia symphoricarpi CBS 119687]
MSTQKQMSLKRKRYDPKPIWAYRENEALSAELQQQEEQRQQSRVPPPAVQPPPQAPSLAQRNGPPPEGPAADGLSGYERPISDDAHIHDDVSRKVCNFIWLTAINNEHVRNAIAESPNTQLEVEARWGQILDRHSNSRLRGFHETECVIRSASVDAIFESTMTMEQHRRMNMYLNNQVQRSKTPGAPRADIGYAHTREIDTLYDLDQGALDQLPPLTRSFIGQAGGRQRIRVTRDAKTNKVIRKLIKHRIANLEISSPQTEWDYRIGINLEIEYPGSTEGLTPVIESGKTLESMQRQKDRMSYSWMGAYQIDLTQVTQGQSKNHELELELSSDVLLDNADRVKRKEANSFEPLINGMMNNLRVLSREMTSGPPGA